MRTFNELRVAVVLGMIVALGLFWSAAASQVSQDMDMDLQELVDRYAPVLYFHQDEIFRPQTVDVMLDTARLRQSRGTLPDVNVLSNVSATALAAYKDVSYYLDVWLGDTGSSDARNYSALRDYYLAKLSPLAGGPRIVTYARVATDDDQTPVAIQYWFFYFYNDWFNKHEGDWEMIQVNLDRAGQPEWAIYSQHHGGTRRAWREVPLEAGTHPAVFVSLGSHANYFVGDETFPHGRRRRQLPGHGAGSHRPRRPGRARGDFAAAGSGECDEPTAGR